MANFLNVTYKLTACSNGQPALEARDAMVGLIGYIRRENSGEYRWIVSPYRFPHWERAARFVSQRAAEAYIEALGYEMFERGLTAATPPADHDKAPAVPTKEDLGAPTATP